MYLHLKIHYPRCGRRNNREQWKQSKKVIALMALPCAFWGTNMAETGENRQFWRCAIMLLCLHLQASVHAFVLSPSPGKLKPVLVFPWLLLDSSVSPCLRLSLSQKRCASDWKSVTFCFQVLHLLSLIYFLHFIFEKKVFFVFFLPSFLFYKGWGVRYLSISLYT